MPASTGFQHTKKSVDHLPARLRGLRHDSKSRSRQIVSPVQEARRSWGEPSRPRLSPCEAAATSTLKLGIDIGETSVNRYLVHRCRPPSS
jgi:hypothetical protein